MVLVMKCVDLVFRQNTEARRENLHDAGDIYVRVYIFRRGHVWTGWKLRVFEVHGALACDVMAVPTHVDMALFELGLAYLRGRFEGEI